MATQLEVIKSFMGSLDKSKQKTGEESLNKAIKAVGLKSFSSLKEAFMTDLRGASDTSVPHLEGETDVEYFLRVYCGINFKTTDSGAITGSDAGGSKTKTDVNIISETKKLNSTFEDNYFKVNNDNDNLTVTLADEKTFSDLTTTQKFIWQGLKTWWIEGALNLIAESYGDNFSFTDKSSATTKELYVKFINDADEDKAIVDCSYNESTGETTAITLTINTAHYKSLDTATANSEFDRRIAHAMTHVVMMANLYYLPLYRHLPGFITEGLAELTIGITNSNADKIKALAADVTKYDVGLDANDLARDESFMYEGGYTFFRYLARQAGDVTIANSSTPDTLLLTFYGNDTIQSSANNVTIQSGYGNDSIKAKGKNLIITSDGGNNSIYLNKNSTNNKITTGSGNDSVYIAADNSYNEISTGNGKNSINIAADNSYNTITAGSGKDYISLAAGTSHHTVDAGGGHDIIYSNSNVALIEAGAGNDSIFVQSDAKKNTINAGAGHDSIYNGAEEVSISGDVGNDYVYLFSSANKNTINSGKGNDFIYIYTGSKNHTIAGGDGDDTVHSEGTNVSIDTGDGKDLIQLYAGDSTANKNTINSGKGDDSIYSGGTKISVNAGEGDDYIHVYSYANDITIKPGVGNDTIESYCTDGFLYRYASGDGNDSIKGFSEKDTLKISDSSYSQKTKGKNVIVTVGTGKITLEGAATLSTLNIIGNTPTLLTVNDSTKSPVTVESSVKVIDASTRTKDLKISGNSLANMIYGGTGNDSILGFKGNDYLVGNAGKDTLNGGMGNDTLTGGGGNDLFISKSGKNVIIDYATGDRISLGAAVTKTTLSGSDVVFTMGSNSLTVKDAKGQTLNMIDSSGKSYSTVVGSSTTLTVTNSTKSPVTVSSSVKVIDASTRTKTVKITGNAKANTIFGGTGNDSILGGAGNDRLYGQAGNDKIYGNAGNDTLRGGDGNDTLVGVADNDVLLGGDGNDSIFGGDGNDSLSGGAGKDTLSGGTGNDTLTGGSGNDLFISKSGKNVITDYATGDRISLGAAVTKTTLSGSDVIFSMGNNSLTVKNAKGQTLSIINSAGKSYSAVVGGSKTLTLTDSDSSPVTVNSSVEIIDASSRTVAVSIKGNGSANTIIGGSANDSLYGRAGNDSIVGNAGNDKLYGSNGNDILGGGAGNDTFWGDAGNDSLYGGDGNDVFVYTAGEGTDRIFDYTSGDMLRILKSDGSAGGTFSNADFSNGTLNLTIDGGGKVIISNVTTSTNFNVNGNSYTISGSKLVEK